MAELEWQGIPDRASLRRALRHGLRRHAPSLRIIAEDFFAETSAIDLLGIGSHGEIVSVRIGDENKQAELFVQALSDLTWLSPRIADLFKLAPDLGLEVSVPPRAMIFCPRFHPESLSAAENLPPRSIEFVEYRCLRQQAQLVLLLEPPLVRRGPSQNRDDTRRTAVRSPGAAATEGTVPLRRTGRPGLAPGESHFRTGLTDADIQQEPASSSS